MGGPVGKQAIYLDGDLSLNVPFEPGEWDDWVAATAVSNHILGNPLIDWLDRHGEQAGHLKSDVPAIDSFTASRGADFESEVVGSLESLSGETLVQIGGANPQRRAASDLMLAEKTWDALASGVGLVSQGVLRDPGRRFHGVADLLVRSDVFRRLFPAAISEAAAAVPAHMLGLGGAHYVVVDIKFKRLEFSSKGALSNAASGRWPAYKAQVGIYAAALARLQGYLPAESYLLGRGWKQGEESSDDCLDRLAAVSSSGEHERSAEEAARWLRRMRSEGAAWDPLSGSMEELLPNLASDNGVWVEAVDKIVEATSDVTKVWMVGAKHRARSLAAGITGWEDERLDASLLGLSGKTATTVDSILEANRSPTPVVLPDRVEVARSEWAGEEPVEFYVDFETVNDIGDDFSSFPLRGGQSMIFMVGCGHIEERAWKFDCFTADRLDGSEEGRIITEWLEHMAATADRLAAGLAAKSFHWHRAEPLEMSRARKRAESRGDERALAWEEPNWFDLCLRVVQAEPVTVTGCFSFGLKDFAKAMHKAGLIESDWDGGMAGGLDAMVGAILAQREVDAGNAGSLSDTSVMREIAEYNEVDCRTVAEILSYLRANR